MAKCSSCYGVLVETKEFDKLWCSSCRHYTDLGGFCETFDCESCKPKCLRCGTKEAVIQSREGFFYQWYCKIHSEFIDDQGFLLNDLGERYFDDVLIMLHSEETQNVAMSAILQLDSVESLQALLAIIDSNDINLSIKNQIAAACRLGKWNISTGIEILEKYLTSREKKYREEVVRRMWKSRSVHFIPLLIKALDDSEIQINRLAIYGLGEIGEESTIPRLKQLRNEKENLAYLIDNTIYSMKNPTSCKTCKKLFNRVERKMKCNGCKNTFHAKDGCISEINIFESSLFCPVCKSRQSAQLGSDFDKFFETFISS
jgi:hypothetical protein